MKKIILSVLLFCSALQAAPYIGVQGTYAHHKANAKLQGKDWVNRSATNAGRPCRVSKSFGLHQGALGLGAVVGYEKNFTPVFSGFIEANYTYFNSHKSKNNIDVYDDDFNITNELAKEQVSLRMRHQFGMMPGINIAITENLSGVMACGLTMTQYSVTGAHNSGTRVWPENMKSKKAFIFGVEPTLGLKYKFSNRMSTRLTVGYNMGQNKRIVDNYIGESDLVNAGVNSSVWIKPRSLNIRAAVIFDF